MARSKLIITAANTGYSTSQVRDTMTVQELIDELEQYDPDSRVYLEFDNGYSYGPVNTIEQCDEEEEEE